MSGVQESPGVLFVLTGRDKLRWVEIDADWDSHLDQHLLGGLSAPDAHRFLEKSGIADRTIRDRMVAGAMADPSAGGDGCLPFYLDLEVGTYRNVLATTGTPTADDFGGTHAEILTRFINHLDRDSEMLLRLASYPSGLDQSVLDHLADRFLDGAARANWSRILGRGFVSGGAGQTAALHALLRQEFQELEQRERGDLYRRIHRDLFSWYEKQAEPDAADGDRAFLAAARHLAKPDDAEVVR